MMIEVSMVQILIIFIIILYIIRRPRIGKNEPPLVPYTIPILGHTYNYLFNTKKFIKECKEKYGNCFSIYVFGHVMTVLSRDSVTDVFRNPNDFDFAPAVHEHLPLNHFFTCIEGLTKEGNKFQAKSVREHVTSKLDVNIGVVQKYLLKGIDKWIGDCDGPKTIYNVWHIINKIITLPIANVFVGEDAASHEDLLTSFGNFANDLSPIILVPPILSFIHPKLHEIAITLPIKFGWNPVSRHRKVIMNRLRPVIENRLKEKKEFGDNYKPYDDLLEYYMNLPDFDYTNPNSLIYHVENLFLMIFASINTTGRATIDALVDLAGRPEVLNELYEEALTIDKECNGSLTLEDIRKMVKLDSFVKESLRLNGNIFALPHYMTSKSYTFSNGFTIREGHKTIFYSEDMLTAKEYFGEDAEEFKPFRFVNTNSSATRVERSYIVFGGGKHACPGRFFAINEAKVFLHKLILKYKVSTENGKIIDKNLIGPLTLPFNGGLIFENRV